MKPVEKNRETESKIDGVLLHNLWGPVITGISLLLIFGILLYLGNMTQNFLMGITDELLALFSGSGSLMSMIIKQGLTGVMAGISIALPYIFLFIFS